MGTSVKTGPRVVVEENIPFARGVLEPYCQVSYLPAEQITNAVMRDADALVTRTRTRCDSALLSDTDCSLVATATIGVDHIDSAYCGRAGITVRNVPGCNAPAVAQYVMSALAYLREKGHDLNTLGVVGVGHVGSLVVDYARKNGMRVLMVDPPRQAAGERGEWSDMSTVAAECDVISFHTPLTDDGKYATRHLADAEWLDSVQHRPVIINAARGGVVDEEALCDALVSGKVSGAVTDCWETEPQPGKRLLRLSDIATPHIAGYSLEGKLRATAGALNAVAGHFQLPPLSFPFEIPGGPRDEYPFSSFPELYDIAADSAALKGAPDAFEALRNHYRFRHE
ncbi:MAG: 4-phosphoerythronate dehydrogenase [Muribaculaceae bacterium]|nr:4-phosphoerythronate dehydrogenase [Muribaculaceae bacterium]